MAPQAVTILSGKRVALGVTGSIAVYKAVDLASKLTQAGASVDVIMTQAAQRFVAPVTFEAVTGRPVYTDLWQGGGSAGLPTHIAHVGLGEKADLLVIAPATANMIAKLAHGLADDLLSVTALAVRCPVLIAPAMDGVMYQHRSVKANLRTLVERGVTVIDPEEGRFASGLVGKGRLPETATLMGAIRLVLGRGGPLSGLKVIVTAGGTKEAIDPVRYITNHSSGKQGYALAQAALDSGAEEVVLISTGVDLPIPYGARIVCAPSAEEMLDAIRTHLDGTHVLLMAAAVADFRPSQAATQKIKKSDDPDEATSLQLVRTSDILREVRTARDQTGWPWIVVGFAAESQDLIANAQRKLERKGLDLIVANDITASDAGFGSDMNRVTLLLADGRQMPLTLLSKAQVSEHVIEQVAGLLAQRQNS
ncbi:MAG: bifunctional phosphopantothenoylcysteine decarboxylase/phosphopantothenate--cysteine ligase CoaBC [Chloroflexi bacterium]|nr:bifunctional phosphopantothenoylcysteine decarboxylase/phosphopantothenate--cysteine ligase CoaBC [Chloroflexota bacterium]